jgi:hypothetical protein
MKCLKDKKTGKLSFKVKKGGSKKELDIKEDKGKDEKEDKKTFPWKK